MLTIQVVMLVFAIFACTRVVLRFRRGTISLAEFGVWLAFWALVGIVVMLPGVTQWFAERLGVGRGADAVFYITLVALWYAVFRLHSKLREIEHQITELVRKLTLEEGNRTHADGSAT